MVGKVFCHTNGFCCTKIWTPLTISNNAVGNFHAAAENAMTTEHSMQSFIRNFIAVTSLTA